MEKQEKTQSRTKVSNANLALYTIFGLIRITLYLLIPALLMVRYINKNLPDSVGIDKFLLLLVTFVFSWVLIVLDYRLILKKQKITIN